MLFSSSVFLARFLPLTVAIASLARFAPYPTYLGVLVAASAIFYAWFVPKYLVLLVASATLNYGISMLIDGQRRPWLYAVGIALNLAALGYFKYRDFVVHNVDRLLGTPFTPANIILPLAISFITFEQIAFLSDVHFG